MVPYVHFLKYITNMPQNASTGILKVTTGVEKHRVCFCLEGMPCRLKKLLAIMESFDIFYTPWDIRKVRNNQSISSDPSPRYTHLICFVPICRVPQLRTP